METISSIEQPVDQYKENDLQIEGWRDARHLLHLYAQIIGKIRLRLHPKLNHWWHATLAISTVGWTTGIIPYKEGCFEIELNFIDHVLWIRKSDGLGQHINLNQPSIKMFHDTLFDSLKSLGIEVSIDEMPFDESKVKSHILFNKDDRPITYNPDFSYNLWKVQLETDITLQIFKGRFSGMSSPVQLFWHEFDLSLTFFSGRKVLSSNGMDKISKEAYSHEFISFGFWAGDDNIDEPAYYSCVYPEPKNLSEEQLIPLEAFWNHQETGTTAILTYRDLQNSPDPRQSLLDFMESAFMVGSRKAKWDKDLMLLRPLNYFLH
ncbi:MAG: DUF5996 family protein [Bacteriovorax sp.]|nr:DUF5996 family protein [Bacteriovorax sp.]